MDDYKKKFQMYFFVTLFLIVLVLTFFIFLPFFIPLSIAIALAVLCRPFYKWLARLTGGRESISAFLTVAAAIFVLLVPLTFIGVTVLQEARELSAEINNGDWRGMARFTTFIEEQVARFSPGFSLNFNEYARQGANWLIQNLGMIFAGIAQVLIGLFLGLMAFYYLLKDGRKLARALVALSPLPDAYDCKILTKLESAVNSIIRGSLVIAIVQGILTGVGLAIFGIPNPALLGSIAAIAALIPGIGTSLVLIPAIIFLFVVGSINSGIGLLIWGAIAVGLIDNILGPKLMGRGIHIHPFLILLSVIGGLGFFGPVGFLLGPLVLSLLFALIEIYYLLTGIDRESLS